MNRSCRRLAFSLLVAGGATVAIAQTATPQQRYEQQLARCNDGSLAAPAREACVRAAGTQLDRANGGLPSEAPVTTQDGRATVVAPEGSNPGSGGSGTVPSRDGRAAIVPPAGSATPR
jgi:hypothetical protein